MKEDKDREKIMSAFVSLGPDDTGRDIKKANVSIEGRDFTEEEMNFFRSKGYKKCKRNYTMLNPNAQFQDIMDVNSEITKRNPGANKSIGIKGHVFWFKWVIPAVVGGILLIKILF